MRTGEFPSALAASGACAIVGFAMNADATVFDLSSATSSAQQRLLGGIDVLALARSGNVVALARKGYGVELHVVTCP